MKNFILLAAGIILTIAFAIFATHIFEAMYYSNVFSNEMYDLQLNGPCAWICIGIAWALAALFYYAINSVSFSRWYHWLIVLVCGVVLSAIATYLFINHQFDILTNDADFSVQTFRMAINAGICQAVIFVVASFSIRWWSSNCRHTPFPE